jgi:small-conductance mechanosensitive channel
MILLSADMNVLFRLLKLISIAVLFVLNENLDRIQKAIHLPGHLTSSLIGFLLFVLITEWGRDLLSFLYRRRKKMPYHKTDNVVIGIQNIRFLILLCGGIYFLLHALNMKPKEFFTGLSLISAALAVVMKDYVSNIVSGMILAFSDKLKIGDYVQIGKHTGEIIDFSLTMITLKNDDDELVYIPCYMIYSHDLINFSTSSYDSVTILFELNHKMKMAFADLQHVIDEALAPYMPYFMHQSPGTLFIHAAAQEMTIFKYAYTLKEKNIPISREIKKTLLKAVYENTKNPTLPE